MFTRFDRTTGASRVDRRRELLWGCASIVAATVVVAALQPHRDEVDPGIVALVLLVAPLLAALASLRVALVVAAFTALAFNFFFTEPYDSLQVHDPTSVVALFTYVIIAVLMALVVARMRRLATTADDRAEQALLLRDLTIDLVRQNVWLQPPLSTALADLVRALHLRGAVLQVQVPDGEQFTIEAGRAAASAAAISEFMSKAADARRGVQSVLRLRDDDDLRIVPIATGGDPVGMLAVEPSPDAELGDAGERVVSLFANVVALACERAAFMQQSVQRRALEESDRLRTSLMQSVSHDLRTPLASVSALASALPDVGAVSAEQQQMLDDIIEQTERLARLVDQVLDVSRIESGTLQLRLQVLELDELVHAAVAAVRLSTGAQIDVTLDDAPAIPVDEVLMRQALTNLLENAVRHGEPPFEVTLRQRERTLELRVVDHGAGIPEAERRRIFDPSYAMRRSSSSARSHGLGIAISAGFVEAHGGHVRVEPTPGGGSTFVVSLPRPAERATEVLT